MSEREIFETMMKWMELDIVESFECDGRECVFWSGDDASYYPVKNDSAKVSNTGYDYFTSGAIFNGDGSIYTAYMDSHVVHSSENADKMTLLRNTIRAGGKWRPWNNQEES